MIHAPYTSAMRSIQQKHLYLTLVALLWTSSLPATGQYECRLKSGQKIFRERSNKNFTLQEQPLIQLTPLSRQIHCQDIREVKLECSVNEPYKVELYSEYFEVLGTGNSISYSFLIPICEKTEHTFTCQVIGRQELKQSTLEITTGAPDCNDDVFGTGNLGQMAFGSCERDEVGERKGVCQEDGSWREVENNCILRPVQELLLQSELLDANSLPGFLDTLSDVTVNFTEEVVKSPTNINAIVDILSNVANTSLPINSDLAKDILLTAGVLTTYGAWKTWESLNNGSRNESQMRRIYTFLQSLENITVSATQPSATTINELSFVLDIDFDESFNEESNDVFINANRAIQTQCRTPQSSCQLSGFRPGSTIGDYTIRGASLSDTELQAIQTGIFLNLSETYPIIFDSQSSLKLEPTTVISQQEATVTCGPPPANLNLGTNWTAEWRFNNNPISSNEDLYEFSKVNEEAVLTLKRFFGTDIGQYECRLKSGQKIFRERSNNQSFTLQEQPLIQLTPLSRQIHCQDIREVKLECSVNEPYTVVLRNSTKVLGTGNSISYSFLILICEKTEHTFTCQVIGRQEFKQSTLEITTGAPDCNDDVFGTGNLGQMAFGSCERDEVGERKGVCQEDGSWREVENNCTLRPVQELLLQSELLDANSLPGFLDTLSDVTVNFTEEVVKSPTNINAIVDILSNVANTSLPINSDLAKDILLTAGVLTTDGATASWESLNNGSRNESQMRRGSTFLQSLETITELSFVLDIDFDESFNEESNDVFINANRAIQTQCRTPQSSCQLSGFRPGSTIGDYTIRGASLSDTELQAIQTGIFLDLSETYPIIFDSQSSLKLEPTTVISQQEATVTCGPPPANLNLGTNWTAEWRFNNNPISSNEDLYEFSKVNEEAVLTLRRFFGTDIGQYECRLKSGQKIFRERSNNQSFTLQEQPLIQLTPLSRQIHCQDIREVKLECSVNEPYTVVLRNSTKVLGTGNSISYSFLIPICEKTEHTFTCQVIGRQELKQSTLEITTGAPDCNNDVFGTGNLGQMAFGSCERDEVGERKGVCQEDGSWREVENNCILRPVQELLLQSELLNANSLPGFLDTLSDVTVNFTEEVVKSPTNINAIVDILSNVANTSLPINSDLAKDILLTAGVLTTDGARGTWESLNNGSRNESQTRSSTFLQSLENITARITDVSLAIDTPSILLNKTTFTDSFNASFNSSVTIVISEPGEGEKNITVMTFASMHNVLPARDEANSSRFDINGRVVLVQTSIGNIPINNISFTFNLNNTSLVNPQCVFWNFSLFDDRGGWDNEGCMPVEIKNGSITCNCNHLTSFSILMSPFVNCKVCSLITFIGVGISMASLVICLIIEAVIWRKIRRNTTSYLRHVSIVNIAVSLLIADIWFIIGASISEAPGDNRDACSAATFFIHFFYLAMFFWMLASALLLLYRIVSVFDGGLSKRSMLAIGFSVGYGGPIIIAVITIAATAPSETYTQDKFCWLNFEESLAIIAFVLPALTIVLFHLIILIVVLFKMLRRRAVADSAQAGQRNVLLVIARTLAVLTPLFGLTWGLGIGTLADPENQGIHIAFSFFNSLQGFFILVFGLLLDKKVRSEIAIKSQISGSGTTSTSAGNTSSAFGFLQLWRRGRDGNNISSNDSNVTQSLNPS
ncbi:uncharacterized protein LOC132984433 [Labrus mixtus]|uniref:uncharacterized protein LOC132984433 n=1 Tax=Labrus mixtus TaxID=508554 RepID=UPI0029C0B08F|nr:uncharacterized protein LOC132984433 [Labrus mixtus]